MSHLLRHYLDLVERHFKIATLLLLIPVVIALLIGFIQPVTYRSTSSLLVVQKQNAVLDAYTAARAAERVGKNLVNVFDSASFRNKVWIITGEDVKKKFGDSEEKVSKNWNKRLSIRLEPDTSILKVAVYAPTVTEALMINQAVDEVLVKQHAEYLSTNSDTAVGEIDPSYVKNRPYRPNFPLNALVGFIAGIIITGCYFVYRSWQEQSIFSI
ncbi:MAG: hypothetical protein V1707_02815 [bacterium]